MSRTKKVKGIVGEMQRIADEARSNSTAAEDTLSAIEDREARRSTRRVRSDAATKFPALDNR